MGSTSKHLQVMFVMEPRSPQQIYIEKSCFMIFDNIVDFIMLKVNHRWGNVHSRGKFISSAIWSSAILSQYIIKAILHKNQDQRAGDLWNSVQVLCLNWPCNQSTNPWTWVCLFNWVLQYVSNQEKVTDRSWWVIWHYAVSSVCNYLGTKSTWPQCNLYSPRFVT